MIRVLLYGDVNLNYRDGSAVWLRSVTECLARAGTQVDVLLKSDAREDELLEPFRRLPGVTVRTPFDDKISGFAGMPPEHAGRRIAELDERHGYDVVITRGFDVAAEVTARDQFAGRCWPYLTEGPAFEYEPTDAGAQRAAAIASAARRVLVQTEEARSVIEALVPAAAGKTLVLNPIVPDEAFSLADGRNHSGELDLVYSGKFARRWNTLEMVDLPAQLAERGFEARLTMVGDKFQLTAGDQWWVDAMKAAAAEDRPGVSWAGGMCREGALAESARHEIGVCWRDAELDGSLEISTKMLEFAAIGTPPVLNRTAMHEALLGTDYPLFVDGNDVLTTLARAGADAGLVAAARERARERVADYSMAATAERMRSSLARALGAQPAVEGPRHKVLLAGHDFKFAGELIDMLQSHPGFELRIDQWTRLAQHDAEASAKHAEWADTIICEWSGPNAVFYSQRVRADQRLLVRFHGFEIRGAWLADIDVSRVDAFVFVSDFYRRQVLDQTGWPAHRTTVIPNAIDAVDLDRPKVPGAEFRIGMAGYVPMLKRPDRALDLLAGLLDHDERYHLVLRGRQPWEYPWEWAKPAQREAYGSFFERIATDDRLREHVTFEPFSADMGSWFRGIGWMVSPSTRETFHLAPVEGMASGALPVIWPREGVEEIFGADLVCDSTQQAVQFVLDNAARWGDVGPAMKQRAQQYDLAQVRDLWFRLVSLPKSRLQYLRGRELSAETVDAWAHDPSSILPPTGLPAALVPDSNVVVAADEHAARPGEVACDPVDDEPARLDHQVHIWADALQRTARRVRASAITASDQAGPRALAAAVAAARLGLPVTWRGSTHADDEGPASAWTHLHHSSRAERPGTSRPLSSITLGLVADQFTRDTFSATLPITELRRDRWRQQLDGLDAVVIESAWEGRDKEWFHGVAYHGEEDSADLRELLAECRRLGIPSIFWNKEDPVHFRSFRSPASWCDHVFTTDAGVLPRYLDTEDTLVRTASALPFFAQPRLHHPVPGGRPFQHTVAFAGSYYGKRYAKRSAELRMIFDQAVPFGLTIYDRQHDRPESPYQLPEELKQYSVGAVSYAEMLEVYRAHPVHINVNSVSDSPSMFSRRVVEIAASGSLVLSGEGRGVREVLGEAFPVLTTAEEWHEHLERAMTDEDARWRAVERQYLAIMRAHRADQALAIMLRTAGIAVDPEPAARGLDLLEEQSATVPARVRELVQAPLWTE
ncbi:glycosyltransferase [Tessaracoccus sp. SD287]|uniref:glycosyltransferase family protein n=1 Tax=Tessaracoccus sp. SD287 TaxID=2782008 RepID=UPI001A96270A|nr:glycosyltransferase [Tessaracoccus sp. SD287]MBO1031884.1 glycosyltransferase [Tessaracoccus sp. SD287]